MCTRDMSCMCVLNVCMFVGACMYKEIYVCMCVHECVCVVNRHVCRCSFTCIYVCTCIHVYVECICVHTYIHTCACMHMCMCMCACVCVLMHSIRLCAQQPCSSPEEKAQAQLAEQAAGSGGTGLTALLMNLVVVTAIPHLQGHEERVCLTKSLPLRSASVAGMQH